MLRCARHDVYSYADPRMLYYLFPLPARHYHLPGTGVFQYISFRAALAVVMSLLIAQLSATA